MPRAGRGRPSSGEDACSGLEFQSPTAPSRVREGGADGRLGSCQTLVWEIVVNFLHLLEVGTCC